MRRKIFVIDDEEDFAYFLKANLELISNYEVMIFTKGKKGIKAAAKEKPALILLDIMMPGMDGFEVLKRLKKNEKTMKIPVIMLTAKNEDESKIEAAGLYCEDYIVKPVEMRVLNSKIHKILSITAIR
jgi:two-component system alkaline phosphatase synthesis response regulator PhoP